MFVTMAGRPSAFGRWSNWSGAVKVMTLPLTEAIVITSSSFACSLVPARTTVSPAFQPVGAPTAGARANCSFTVPSPEAIRG
jgi:hypothetical protein